MSPDLYKEVFLKNYFASEERSSGEGVGGGSNGSGPAAGEDQSGNDSGTSNEDLHNAEVGHRCLTPPPKKIDAKHLYKSPFPLRTFSFTDSLILTR